MPHQSLQILCAPLYQIVPMAKAGKVSRQRQPAAQRLKKRRLEPAALPEHDDGDIFQDSDSDRGGEEEDAHEAPRETPAEARLRLGDLRCPKHCHLAFRAL